MINDGKHSDVRVQIKLEFHSFSEYAVDESVAIRFQDTQADKVLGFFANAGIILISRFFYIFICNILISRFFFKYLFAIF